MPTSPNAESTPSLDEGFLHEVDDVLRATFERVLAHEQDIAPAGRDALQRDEPWQTIMGRIHERLDAWQVKLSGTADEVRSIEADLQEHQGALRAWAEALEAVRKLPGKAAGGTTSDAAEPALAGGVERSGPGA